MQNRRYHRRKPAYPIESVDNALALIEMLRDFGTVRLVDAAAELGVSRSTVHRLMAMLVYRGFAEQDQQSRYVPGPALGVPPAGVAWTSELRRRSQEHLQALVEQIGETVNLMVRAGAQVRFLATAQGGRPQQVGDRQGAVMPAEKASAGKAMLADLGDARLRALYERQAAIGGRRFDEQKYAALVQELETVRSRGFAVNLEETESGVNALGVSISDGAGETVGGLSVAIAPMRFREVFESGLLAAVFAARERLEAELSDFIAGEY